MRRRRRAPLTQLARAGERTQLLIGDAPLAQVRFTATVLGGTPEENGEAFRALLDGAKGAYRDAVLLNAAAALVVADKVASLPEGAEMAAEAIDSGAAKAKVEGLAKITSAA